MDEPKQEQGKAQKEPRCEPKQLEILKRCYEKKDTSEWNKWREKNRLAEIWLQGAKLWGAHLEEADVGYVHLEGANLTGANLKRANLEGTHLEGAQLTGARLGKAELIGSHLEEANIAHANLVGANLLGAHLERAKLQDAYLEGADVRFAHLEATVLTRANLKGADFRASLVDGSTLFWFCTLNDKTDFRGVGLDSCRMDENTRYRLEYNRRRMNCEDWYERHPGSAWLVKAFFWTSDYGRSTGRMIFTFFGLVLIFAVIYCFCAFVNSPGIISNLLEGNEGSVPAWLVLFRTIYFSIITMTTLGFSDMHANCQSFWGHLLIAVQVILGYVLLAALATRIGVLFTSGLVAGQLKEEEKFSRQEFQKTKEED